MASIVLLNQWGSQHQVYTQCDRKEEGEREGRNGEGGREQEEKEGRVEGGGLGERKKKRGSERRKNSNTPCQLPIRKLNRETDNKLEVSPILTDFLPTRNHFVFLFR